jgi:acetyl esterase
LVPDYANLIDAETWRFIEQTNRYYPADAVQRSLAEQRRTYDRMCREFHRAIRFMLVPLTG